MGRLMRPWAAVFVHLRLAALVVVGVVRLVLILGPVVLELLGRDAHFVIELRIAVLHAARLGLLERGGGLRGDAFLLLFLGELLEPEELLELDVVSLGALIALGLVARTAPCR